jgi:hypothetical protein
MRRRLNLRHGKQKRHVLATAPAGSIWKGIRAVQNAIHSREEAEAKRMASNLIKYFGPKKQEVEEPRPLSRDERVALINRKRNHTTTLSFST